MTSTVTSFKCWRDATHKVAPHPTYHWPRCIVCGAAPAYHERPRYLPDDFTLNLYVPATAGHGGVVGGSLLTIKHGSGIVGLPTRSGDVEICYEGFIFEPGLITDAARWRYAVLHAAGRQIVAYPTVARMWVPADNLIEVGTYNPTHDSFSITNRGPLVAWINDTEV
jgi:hypothetical protein